MAIGEEDKENNNNNKNDDADVTIGEVNDDAESTNGKEIGVLLKNLTSLSKLKRKAHNVKINS